MKKFLPLTEIVLAFLLAFLVINLFFHESKQFENLDLGSETSPYYASVDSFSVHLSNAASSDFEDLQRGWKHRGAKDVILILGNSQTHAINQLKSGEVNYPGILFQKFRDSFDVLTHSIPNANLQEFYLLYSYWTSKFPVKKVVLPVFIDDLREDGIRSVYTRMITQDGFKIDDSTATATNINEQISSFTATSKDDGAVKEDMKALKETVQEKSETYLNGKLQASFNSWNYRETVRGDLFTFMYKLRNTVLGINPQTKRSLIPALKEKNMAALEQVFRDAQKKGIELYIYVPPVRYDVSPPYFEDQYNSTIAELHEMLRRYKNTKFARLDKIIEGKYWGTKDPTAFFRDREYDFMHFQYRGHQVLADSLFSFIKGGK